ncbi:hypothetical protein L4C44_01350 [Vibrio satsumensis]|uniref:hypothetical protein n=1 Tax=Vibrio TaxID=662 RepID=UPI001B3024BD|nr:hypothetical protein [Vibrio crassostreae]
MPARMDVVVEGVDGIFGLFKWFEGIDNAHEQMDRFQHEREHIARTLPKGSSKDYQVITKGNKFHSLIPTDEAHLLPGDVQFGPIERIYGMK